MEKKINDISDLDKQKIESIINLTLSIPTIKFNKELTESIFIYLKELNTSPYILSMDDAHDDHYLRDETMLRSAIEVPLLLDYKQYGPDLFTKLANLWFKLTNNHPFSNGNKRTSLVGAKTLFITYYTETLYSFIYNRIKEYIILEHKELMSNKKIDYKKIKKNQPDLSLNQYVKNINKSKDRLIKKFRYNNATHEKFVNYINNKILMPLWLETINDDRKITIMVSSEVNQSNPNEVEKAINHLKLNLVNLAIKAQPQIDKLIQEHLEDIEPLLI